MSARFMFILLLSMLARAQAGFQFSDPHRDRVKIPFTLINDLIIVPVQVNGAKLNFLLDTGVDETILFSLEDQDEIQLNQVEKVRLKGLGGNEPVDGLKSSGNVVGFPGFKDVNHDIYIVLDQSFNFSASIGIPVNGIIGYRFFSRFLVLIDYDASRIVVYQNRKSAERKLRKFEARDLMIEEKKPYAIGTTQIGDKTYSGKMLLDTGSADAVWIFNNRIPEIPLPEGHFSDFLGRGLSGEILGERARVNGFQWYGFLLPDALIAFPDSLATKNVIMAKDRIGSVGGEVFRRFDVAFDYSAEKIYLRKGRHYDDPFTYNMSGMEIQHDGMTWTSERVDLNEKKSNATTEINLMGTSRYSYSFTLRPVFSIANVRAGSPAENCGFKKGDILVSINGQTCGRMTLQEIRELLQSGEGRQINFEVERNGKPFKCRFRLKKLI